MKEKKQQDAKAQEVIKDDKIQQQIQEYKKKLDEYTNDLKRLQAEFENYKKRNQREVGQILEYSNAGLISRLLVVLDDFDSCLKNLPADEHTHGIDLLHKKLLKILKEEGLYEIEAKGKFDPYKHEAMLYEDSGGQDGEIIEVIQKGYMLKDKVLRHAKVKVAKQKQEEEQNANGQGT